jgi:hypothetical protein
MAMTPNEVLPIPTHPSITSEAVIVKVPITARVNANGIDNIPNAIPPRSASVPAAVSRIVAVYEFAAFIVLAPKYSTSAMTSAAALTKCCRRNDHCQQQSQNEH